MKSMLNLKDLLQQDDAALTSTSTLLGQELICLDCTGVESMGPGQMDLLFADIPDTWDFMALADSLHTGSVTDSLAQQISEWLDRRTEQSGSEREVTGSDRELVSKITLQNLDKILTFLPIFARRDSRLYEVDAQQKLLDPYTYSSEVDGWIQALFDEGFILLSFNWGIWLEEAKQFVNEPEQLNSADLLTLQKLLTSHIRSERFNNGHLAHLIDNGHIRAILERLAVIQAEMVEASDSTASPGSSSSRSRITATRGDITQQQVDAIVNTTDTALEAGGGVSKAIHDIAGPRLREECRKLRGCAVGQAKVTHSYNLPAPWIIHTVGPVWQGGKHQEDNLLAQCYYNCLALAALCPIQTIAFPSISTGNHQFPIDRAVKIAVAAVQQFLEKNASIEKVIFVCAESEVFDAYSKAIKTYGEALDPALRTD